MGTCEERLEWLECQIEIILEEVGELNKKVSRLSRGVSVEYDGREDEDIPSPYTYSKIPDTVLLDRELSLSSIKVYTFLSYWGKGKTSVYVGVRKVAEKCGLSPSAVVNATKQLHDRRHITKLENERGKRSGYRLDSEVFTKPSRRKY